MQTLTMNVRARLSIMMFLQFFIWGVWFVSLGTYLSKTLHQDGMIGAAYGTMSWGAIFAPMLVGMIADRFFPAQYVLSFCHLIGAGLLYLASKTVEPTALYWTLIGYAIFYNPTLPLVNAISFPQLDSPQKQFPGIRVFGTVGWIVAGWVNSLMGLEKTSTPMAIAAGCSVLLAVFSLVLPHTPPKSTGRKVTLSDVFGLEALSLMKNRSFAIFVIGSLLICIPLSFYYNFTNLFLENRGVLNPSGKMTFGQMSEFFFMLVMPFFFTRLGVKKMLLIGMAAWALRYVLFAFGDAGSGIPMLYTGLLLHGVCFDFFFVTGQIYTDNTAPKAIQASAQGFIGVITYGGGLLIGAYISGAVYVHYKAIGELEKVDYWKPFWIVPAIMAGAVMLLFAIFFREEKVAASADDINAAGAALEME